MLLTTPMAHVRICGELGELAAVGRREEHEIAARFEPKRLQRPADHAAVGRVRRQHRDLDALDQLAELRQIGGWMELVFHVRA